MKVVIVGAGLSGTLTAVHLLARATGPMDVTLVERSGDFGPGVAYATRDGRHLLNVPACRMSAFGHDPDHFLRWARARRGGVDRAAYLPRRDYGEYLRDTLARAARSAGPGRRLRRLAGEVTDVRPAGRGGEVVLDDGTHVAADYVVLAVGSLPPTPPPDVPDDPRIVADPWSAAAHAPADAGTHTVVVGTGLTAVDVVLSVTARAGGGSVTAVSRRGRLPHVHLPGIRDAAPAPALPAAPASLTQLERLVLGHIAHMRAQGFDWRDAFDGLRPHVPDLWKLLPAGERRAFLDRRVRDWDVCRHRMAPEVGRRIEELIACRRLEIAGGGVAAIRPAADALVVELLGDPAPPPLRADRIVLCTGAGRDLRAQPLLGKLLEQGRALTDDLGLGLRTTASGALLDAEGAPQRWLVTLGPPRRGDLWETTAAREIRDQAEGLAAMIATEAQDGALAAA